MNQGTEKQKLYCYVDESGQDTLGEFFIVSVVVSGENKDLLTKKLEEIEQVSGKGKVKWMKARKPQRLAYMQGILASSEFKNTLYFSFYKNTKSYMALTVLATANTILLIAAPQSQKRVYVDGLPKARLRWFGTELRSLSIHNVKVSGVRKEEASALMRLADALAGFVRLATLRGDKEIIKLFDDAKRNGYIKQA